MFQQIIELRGKGRVLLRRAIFALQIKHERHKRFGDIAPTKLTKMATLVGLVAKGVGVHIHRFGSIKPRPFRGGVGVGSV